MKVKFISFLTFTLLIGLCIVIAGCGSTRATKGATGGAAAGAVAGGLLGGWRGAAVGAAVGTGVGYIAGNEADKRQAKEEAAHERAELAKSKVSNDPKTAYRPPNKNPFPEPPREKARIDYYLPSPQDMCQIIVINCRARLMFALITCPSRLTGGNAKTRSTGLSADAVSGRVDGPLNRRFGY